MEVAAVIKRGCDVMTVWWNKMKKQTAYRGCCRAAITAEKIILGFAQKYSGFKGHAYWINAQ